MRRRTLQEIQHRSRWLDLDRLGIASAARAGASLAELHQRAHLLRYIREWTRWSLAHQPDALRFSAPPERLATIDASEHPLGDPLTFSGDLSHRTGEIVITLPRGATDEDIAAVTREVRELLHVETPSVRVRVERDPPPPAPPGPNDPRITVTERRP